MKWHENRKCWTKIEIARWTEANAKLCMCAKVIFCHCGFNSNGMGQCDTYMYMGQVYRMFELCVDLNVKWEITISPAGSHGYTSNAMA